MNATWRWWMESEARKGFSAIERPAFRIAVSHRVGDVCDQQFNFQTHRPGPWQKPFGNFSNFEISSFQIKMRAPDVDDGRPRVSEKGELTFFCFFSAGLWSKPFQEQALIIVCFIHQLTATIWGTFFFSTALVLKIYLKFIWHENLSQEVRFFCSCQSGTFFYIFRNF